MLHELGHEEEHFRIRCDGVMGITKLLKEKETVHEASMKHRGK
jgi:hypothetical protein